MLSAISSVIMYKGSLSFGANYNCHLSTVNEDIAYFKTITIVKKTSLLNIKN
jgi:hypothetical protein